MQNNELIALTKMLIVYGIINHNPVAVEAIPGGVDLLHQPKIKNQPDPKPSELELLLKWQNKAQQDLAKQATIELLTYFYSEKHKRPFEEHPPVESSKQLLTLINAQCSKIISKATLLNSSGPSLLLQPIWSLVRSSFVPKEWSDFPRTAFWFPESTTMTSLLFTSLADKEFHFYEVLLGKFTWRHLIQIVDNGFKPESADKVLSERLARVKTDILTRMSATYTKLPEDLVLIEAKFNWIVLESASSPVNPEQIDSTLLGYLEPTPFKKMLDEAHQFLVGLKGAGHEPTERQQLRPAYSPSATFYAPSQPTSPVPDISPTLSRNRKSPATARKRAEGLVLKVSQEERKRRETLEPEIPKTINNIPSSVLPPEEKEESTTIYPSNFYKF